MPLAEGTRLGRYQIGGLIGAGGMGVVYRAEDTKLKREVAIKVLPEAFAQDSERMKRLEREAQVLASLNHPNIAAIHGLEESDGQRFLVLELAEGEDLAERLSRGAIPVDEAIQIAKQIAEGLEQAHEKGIIHRDLKPANVKVSRDGVVKILDFGLAKALAGDIQEVSSSNASQSPTVARPATVAGVILGTPAYMSPEQARGKTVDRRSDIWAFGLVLYEMLTGRKPFEDETVEPDFDALPGTTPLPIRRLLRRCLQREPKRRLQAIGDARLEIEETQDAPSPRVQHRASPVALMMAAAASAGALAMWLLLPSPNPSRSVVRSVLAGADTRPIRVHTHNSGQELILSPDGNRVVYNADRGDGGSLVLQRLSDFASEPLPDPGGHLQPLAFSPDGTSILFTTNDLGLYRMGLASGNRPQRLCETSTIVWGAAWLADDTVVFAAGEPSSLYRVPSAGGTPQPLAVSSKRDLRWPSVLPGGDRLLVAASPVDGSGSTDIAIVSLGTGELKVVQPGATMPRYLPTGQLVFGAENQLRAVRFNLSTGAIEGAAVSLIDGVETDSAGATSYAVSDGELVYLSGSGGSHPVWVSRTGQERPLPIDAGRYYEPRISPEGTRVAFTDRSGHSEFFVWDESRQALTRVPRSSKAIGASLGILWTPDGRDLLFYSGFFSENRLLRRAADGSSPAVDLNLRGFRANSWSPDGETLLLYTSRPRGTDIFALSMVTTGQPEPILATPSEENNATLSPDGRWLAYMSDESGRYEVYVRPFPDVNGGKWLISTDGGAWPLWTRGGREIVYRSGTKLMAVAVAAGASFKPGRPEELWDRAYFARTPLRDFDVSADGGRFLFLREEGGVGVVLVQNWFEEVKAKVGR